MTKRGTGNATLQKTSGEKSEKSTGQLPRAFVRRKSSARAAAESKIALLPARGTRLYVYDLVATDGSVQYVGLTNNPRGRCRGHARTAMTGESFEFRVVSEHPNLGRGSAAEEARIRLMRPPRNTHYNDDVRASMRRAAEAKRAECRRIAKLLMEIPDEKRRRLLARLSR